MTGPQVGFANRNDGRSGRLVPLWIGVLSGLLTGMVLGLLLITVDHYQLYYKLEFRSLHRYVRALILLMCYGLIYLVPAIIWLRHLLAHYGYHTHYLRSFLFFGVAGYLHFLAFVLTIGLYENDWPRLKDMPRILGYVLLPSLTIASLTALFFRKNARSRMIPTTDDILDDHLQD